MAASPLTEEEAIQNLPAKITKGAARGAWAKREEVWKLHLDGKSPEDIKDKVHQPVRLVEWLISKLPEAGPKESGELGGEQGKSGTEGPTDPEGSKPEGTPVGAHADARTRVEPVGERSRPSGDRVEMASQLEAL